MNKYNITAIIIIILFLLFMSITTINSNYSTIVNVENPTKFEIINNSKKNTTKSEFICVDGIESFSLNPNEEFINKYSNILKISKMDLISLGYLAQEYSQKAFTNKQVKVIYTPKITPDCRYAKVKIDGILYSKLLKNNGFALINNNIVNKKKFEQNLEQARKLNLVILNHHSDKYHTLDCPYGNAAHDSVIIPKNQLPKTSKPCQFCHNINNKLKKNSEKSEILLKAIKPALTIKNGDIKIYLTDYTTKHKPDTNCSTIVCKQLTSLINNTKSTIDIAAYGYDNIPAITSALTKAKNRGVNIQYVYDSASKSNNDYYKDNDIIAKLATKSASDKSNSEKYSNMIMHNKFLIFDKNTVYTGSLNLSRSGLSDFDVNDIIIINSKEIANLYYAEFEQMLNGKFHKLKSKLNLQNKFAIGNTNVEIYFSPKDKVDDRIINLINSSKSYIYIPTFLITHSKIAEALIQAKNRGVDVRVIIDANSTSTRNSKHALLRSNGILLKTENYAGKLHIKSMIIDDKYLVTGSMNFSNSGVNKNDENILVIENSDIAKFHKIFFLYLWTLIPNKYLKHNARAEAPESLGSCSDGVDNNFNGRIDIEEEACK